MTNQISRREALKTGLAAGLFSCAVAGCQTDSAQQANSGQPVSVAGQAGAGGSFTIPAGNLETAGQVLATLPDQRAVMIFKTQSGTVAAVSAKCSHQGCALSFDSAANLLNCPCHGSQFDTAGKVLKGPATAPLEKFSVEIKGSDAILKS